MVCGGVESGVCGGVGCLWAEDVMGDGVRVMCAESGSLRDWASGVYEW